MRYDTVSYHWRAITDVLRTAQKEATGLSVGRDALQQSESVADAI